MVSILLVVTLCKMILMLGQHHKYQHPCDSMTFEILYLQPKYATIYPLKYQLDFYFICLLRSVAFSKKKSGMNNCTCHLPNQLLPPIKWRRLQYKGIGKCLDHCSPSHGSWIIEHLCANSKYQMFFIEVNEGQEV